MAHADQGSGRPVGKYGAHESARPAGTHMLKMRTLASTCSYGDQRVHSMSAMSHARRLGACALTGQPFGSLGPFAGRGCRAGKAWTVWLFRVYLWAAVDEPPGALCVPGSHSDPPRKRDVALAAAAPTGSQLAYWRFPPGEPALLALALLAVAARVTPPRASRRLAPTRAAQPPTPPREEHRGTSHWVPRLPPSSLMPPPGHRWPTSA
jgi:hypothetical protein